MVLFGTTSADPTKPPVSRESKTKTLIMRAWRERWTDIQWGIHARTLIENDSDASFIADCLLQQALNGPGPNALVLSYLLHSFYSQLVPSAAVLKSISQYDGYHKPFCIASMLDVLDNIKERIIISDGADPEECLQLALSVESVVHWLLTCMYSSLENLCDLTGPEGPPQDAEDSRIVLKCRKLIEFIFGDTYLSALLHVAAAEDQETYEKIKRMCAEVEKFSRGHNAEDIAIILTLIDGLKSYRLDQLDSRNRILSSGAVDGLEQVPLNCSIQAIIMTAALLRSSKDIHTIVSDMLIVKQLQAIKTVDLYTEIVHSSMLGLIDAVGREEELKFIGFTFLQLPAVLRAIRDKLSDFSDDLYLGLEAFVMNESVLDAVDAKLHCSSLELFTSSLHKNGLISENQKLELLNKKSTSYTAAANAPKSNSSNAVLILKAETTLGHVLKTLDGDFQKNMDAILAVLCDMLGKSFELILVAASTTGTLQQVTSRLIKLNQLSRQVNGEGTKASGTRALIFDISFLMLCHTVQNYGPESLNCDEPDCFFDEWYKTCMVEGNTAKNPEGIVARCDPNKVDMLLNQYLQGDTELKTSLVFWHEVCTNSVGVVQNLLLAWENGAVSFTDVKKVLDVFKSRICTLPVCISAWLCAYIQVMPEELCGKARYILDYFLNQQNLNDDTQEYFKERCSMMSSVISKMMSCIQPATESSTQKWCVTESKPAAELIESCWKQMSERGLINVETTLNLKNLMEMSGHVQFIQFIVQEMFGLQYSLQLKQWCDLSYGVVQVDVKNSVEALLSKVLPAVLRFSVGSQHFVEPQLVALVNLAADAVISYHLHSKYQIKAESMSSSDDGEPGSKRRKVQQSSSQGFTVGGNSTLEYLLKDLYEEFEETVCGKYEKNPQGVFILRFLEQLAFKSPDLSLLHSTSHKLITHLMTLLHEEVSPKFLLCLHNLADKIGRRNCAEAICHLKALQQAED